MLGPRRLTLFKENGGIAMHTPARGKSVASGGLSARRSTAKTLLRSGSARGKGILSARRALGDISNNQRGRASSGGKQLKKLQKKLMITIAAAPTPQAAAAAKPKEDPFEVECLLTEGDGGVESPPPFDAGVDDLPALAAAIHDVASGRRRFPKLPPPAKMTKEHVPSPAWTLDDLDSGDDNDTEVPSITDLLHDPELGTGLDDSIELHVAFGAFQDEDGGEEGDIAVRLDSDDEGEGDIAVRLDSDDEDSEDDGDMVLDD